MRFQRAFLAAAFLAAFSLTGCNLLSPTEPGDAQTANLESGGSIVYSFTI
jgi:hypothetical protein